MTSLSFLIKPASSLCNMRCAYCFYADVSEHRRVKSYGIMSTATVSALMTRVREEAPDEVTFAFQGGEPTLAGLDFFKSFTQAAKEALPNAKLHYSIQTNGILLDEGFIAFFKNERFLVGLSLDGFLENHDYMRKDAGGGASFNKVLSAYKRLVAAGVDVNILTVITGPLAKRATKLWHFYEKHGMDFVQFIPCLDALDENERTPWSLTPRLYAKFLKELFSLWKQALLEEKYVSMRLFDNLIRRAAGEPPELCGMCGKCSPQFVIEADGSVYPCDFYVLDELSCGNVHEDTLETIRNHPNMTRFLSSLSPKACSECRYFSFCGGGCKRYRQLYLKEDGYCPWADFLSSAQNDILAARRFVFGY